MAKKVEYWDLFHQDGRLAGTMRRGEYAIPPHLFHKTVEVIPTDKAGHLLITRRDMKKRKGAGMFEFPAGSVIAGEEPFEAARRELMEETGLRSKRLYKLHEASVPGMRRYVYLAFIPELLTATITLQKEETMDYRIVTVEQWLECIAKGMFDSSRIQLYNDKVYENLEKMVGQPDSESPVEPKNRPKLHLVPPEQIPGDRCGTSGKEFYIDPDAAKSDEDEREEMKWIESFPTA